MPSCQSTGVKLGPTAVSVCERCMKGKARGGRVAEEESDGGNEIVALHESAMPFVPVHRGEARADGDVGVQAVYEGEGQRRRSSEGGEPLRKDGAGGVVEEESHCGNEIDRDDDDDEEWRY
ncbi:hypothetical protein Scep_023588 [Stephania cephalantha]|uniref:Uncharacterized protein n=1 Tax=Stephania cephalantha TaxID=152367 RepID=A0AAP0F0E9_9MAGN